MVKTFDELYGNGELMDILYGFMLNEAIIYHNNMDAKAFWDNLRLIEALAEITDGMFDDFRHIHEYDPEYAHIFPSEYTTDVSSLELHIYPNGDDYRIEVRNKEDVFPTVCLIQESLLTIVDIMLQVESEYGDGIDEVIETREDGTYYIVKDSYTGRYFEGKIVE